jgi:hypothetical protein
MRWSSHRPQSGCICGVPSIAKEILDISAHYDSLIAVPATISKGANQSASAGGLRRRRQ